MNLAGKKLLTGSACCFLIFGALIAVYVFTILWRVSFAERDVMGKDLMLHILKSPNEYKLAPTLDSYMSFSYRQKYKNMSFFVWPDKINGFQHTFGSSLAAFELGDILADKLFVANEWAEWLFDKNGINERDLRDRRRDLANNKIGRGIAKAAHKLGYFGHDADEYMRDRVVVAIECDHSVITHWLEPKVDSLPTEAELGCPFLPTMNGYDCCRIAKAKAKRLRRRIARKLHTYWSKVESLVS